LFVGAVVFAAFAASALGGSHAAKLDYEVNGSITNSDPVFPGGNSGPLLSNATRSTCGAAGAQNPPVDPPPPYHYKVYHFKNLRGWWAGGNWTPASTCVNVTLLVQSGTAAAMGLNRPLAGCLDCRFAGSVGGLGAGQAADFSYNCCNPTFEQKGDIVVYETTVNGGATYTLLIEGVGIVMTGGGSPTASTGLQSFRASSALDGVRISWRTNSEQGALGFNVYRGSRKKVRLTSSLVRAIGEGRGHSYRFVDRSAGKSRRGPYYLEVVQRSGSKVMFGPALMTAR
jgi:hypothetical protein